MNDLVNFIVQNYGWVTLVITIIVLALTEAIKIPFKMLTGKIKNEKLRQRRENECFPVINRGNLWYSTLTDDQRIELTAWYKAWLDCTDSLSAPEKPTWLK
jgi:hypothetical protein